jgi:hypothetical protein
MRIGLFDGPGGPLLGVVRGTEVMDLAQLVPGTPGGVCLGGDEFVAPGDHVVCEIGGIGRICQRVVADDGSYVRGSAP